MSDATVTGSAAIEARALVKTFDRVQAVRGIDLRVERGERIAFIGPNGAGKSTSIKMFTGILHPTSGEATVLGLVPWQQRQELAARIGVLFGQRSQLWSEITARRGLQLIAAIYRLQPGDVDRRIAEVANLLSASYLLDEKVRSFSLGQRMRCELMASVLHSPDVLFLDEPTIGLDLGAKQLFRELVLRLNEEQHTTIFLTSHDVTDIEAVAERVVIINNGTVVYDDTVSELRSSLLGTKLLDVEFEHEADVSHLGDLDGVEVVDSSALACELRVDTSVRSVKDVLNALLEHHDVADISVNDPPLEEVIGEIYAGRA